MARLSTEVHLPCEVKGVSYHEPNLWKGGSVMINTSSIMITTSGKVFLVMITTYGKVLSACGKATFGCV